MKTNTKDTVAQRTHRDHWSTYCSTLPHSLQIGGGPILEAVKLLYIIPHYTNTSHIPDAPREISWRGQNSKQSDSFHVIKEAPVPKNSATAHTLMQKHTVVEGLGKGTFFPDEGRDSLMKFILQQIPSGGTFQYSVNYGRRRCLIKKTTAFNYC